MKKKAIFLVLFLTLISITSYAVNNELSFLKKHHSLNLLDTTKPVIIHIPIISYSISRWPASVNAIVTDSSGIDSVWVKWYKNNPQTMNRQFKLNNTSGNNYSAMFNSNNSEVFIGDSIFYKIFAKDNSGNHNTDSTVLYGLKITACFASIGNGTIPMGSGPFNTYWYGNRTQLLYLASEILTNGGDVGNILKIGFNVSIAGGQTMNGFNIRVQHTDITTLTGFVNTGWTTIYSGSYSVPGTGWQYIDMQYPYFHYNGISNLLFEICFGNTSYTTATTVLGTTISGMEYTEYHDISTACTTFLNPTAQSARANIRLLLCLIDGIEPKKETLPIKYSLSQNYPNPFNPTTNIRYEIPKSGFVNLIVFDVLGRKIQTLINESLKPGSYEVTFDARQPGLGSNFPSGIYFYQLRTDNFVQTKKLILLK